MNPNSVSIPFESGINFIERKEDFLIKLKLKEDIIDTLMLSKVPSDAALYIYDKGKDNICIISIIHIIFDFNSIDINIFLKYRYMNSLYNNFIPPNFSEGILIIDYGYGNIIKNIITKQLNVSRDRVTYNASFSDDLDADSLDTVELVMKFEEEFNIDIPYKDVENIITVKDSIDYINKRLIL